MAALAQSGAAGLAAAAAGTSRQRKRTSSSRTASEANAGENGAAASQRNYKKGHDAPSPAASVDVSQGDNKQEVGTTSLAATGPGANLAKPANITPQISWSLRLLRGGRHSTGGRFEAAKQQASKALREIGRNPLFSTFVVIAIAGLITSYLLDWTTRRHSGSFGDAKFDDLAAMQNKLLSLDEHVQNMLPKLAAQLEVAHTRVDKLQKEHNELEKKMEEESSRLDGDVKVLKVRVDHMDPFVQRLMANGGEALKKQMEGLVQSAVDHRAAEGAGQALSLEDVRVAARAILEEELIRHAADGIAMPDYALASGGGRVLDHSEAVHSRGWGLFKLARLVGRERQHPMAQKVLEPCAGVPGQCLPLKGTNGTVDIALRTPILPSDVTLEHIAESVSYEIKSAPRNFRIFGWQRPSKDLTAGEPVVPALLGEFTYELQKRPVQTFKLPPEAKGKPINAVRLHVLSNHGNPSHTCLYRLRVHGSPIVSQPQSTVG